MKTGKTFIMPPVRITPPTLEGQTESPKSLKEWLETEETVRGFHFSEHTEESINCHYTDCNAQYLNLSMSKINQAHFSTCNLRNSDINDCRLTSIAFEHCELVESEFSHTSLKGIDFSNSHIEGIRVNLPDIRGAIVNTMQAIDLTSLLGLTIKD